MDYIEIGGKKVRVECDFNAFCSYLKDIGEDTMDGLMDTSKLKPSNIPALMAACVNEGERLDGRESSLTALQAGELGFSEIGAFLNVYASQSLPKVKDAGGKKKAEGKA